MGRPKGTKNINNKLEALVLLVKALNPDWSAEKVRQYLARATNGNLIIPKNLLIPKKRTIQKILAEGKPQLDALNEEDLDKPWHLGLMREYDITAEAVPYIAGIQDWGEKVPDAWGNPRKPLTIRQALWASRLYKFVGWYLNTLDKKQKRQAPYHAGKFLWEWSEAYAQYEIICKLASVPFETEQLDKAIRKGAIASIVATNAIMYFYPQDRILGIVTHDKELLEKMKKDGEK